MAKAKTIGEQEAFEIIELATFDVDTLARAFNLIAEVCAEGDDKKPRAPKLKANQVDSVLLH